MRAALRVLEPGPMAASDTASAGAGERPTAGPGIGGSVTVALRIADPVLRGRLARLLAAAPGTLPVAGPKIADALIADAATALPEAPDAPPALVLAEGAAAQARALRAGARGVLAPDAAAAQLVAAVAAVAHGLRVLPAEADPRTVTDAAPAMAAPAAAPTLFLAAEPAASLTPREREVLSLIAAGAANKVIARRLGVSFHTAKAHVAAVLAKLGASSRADAVARGVRAGLVLL